MKKLLLIVLLFYITQAKAQIITTYAGTGYGAGGVGAYSGDGGAATNAELNYPRGLASDNLGNIYIADYNNNRIRKVNTNGIITTIVGNGVAGFSGDGGAATAGNLDHPWGIAFDGFGNLYFSDSNNRRIRKVDTNGIISTIAGNGTIGYSGDGGAATNATLNYPEGLALDNLGNIYIADALNNVVRMINTNGLISTVAGNGIQGFSGDSGLAVNAELYNPKDVVLDAARNLYISDFENQRIRLVNFTTGIITTFAGGGTGLNNGALATNSRIDPNSLTIDVFGNIYFSDDLYYIILKVNTSGIMTTIAGNGILGYSGDGGPATNAELGAPAGLPFDASGNLYDSDFIAHVIRKITNVTNGINQFTNNNQLNIYPNPAQNKITIDASDVVEVKLFDVVGKQIANTKENQVDISNFNDGVYFIQVKTSTTTTTQKIIVQH